MARINIDDSFFIDARRAVLIKELTRLNIVDYEALATGLLIRAWFYAQRFWLDGQKLIPADEFEALGFTPLLVSKLAEIRPDGVYIRGTEKHSEWIQQRRNAGKSGSDKRWKKAETSTDSEAIATDSEAIANDSEAIANDSEAIANDSGACPLTLTLALTPALAQNLEKKINKKKDAQKINSQYLDGLPAASAVAEPLGKKIFQIWNTYRGTLPAATKLTSKRNKQAESRWSEQPAEDYWQSVVKKLSHSDFATGSNDRKWKASFDWLIANDTNHVKVAEGKYDNRVNSQTPASLTIVTAEDLRALKS